MGMTTRSLILWTLLVLLIVPAIILGMLSYHNARDILIEQIKDSNLKTMENAKSYFLDSYIKELESAAYILSSQPGLKEGMKHPEQLEGIMEEWASYMKYHSYIWYIYVGTEDGGIYVTPDWNPPEDYDPRVRPWYQAALTNPGHVVWSEPYIEYITNNRVISMTLSIEDQGKLLGVFAIDTSLEKLSEIIGAIRFGEDGYAMLIDKDGNVLAHRSKVLIGTNISRQEWFSRLTDDQSEPVFYNMEGRDFLISSVTIPQTGWKLLGFIPQSTLESQVAPMNQETFGVIAISGLIAVVLSVLLSDLIATHVNKFIYVMDEVEQGNFQARCTYRFPLELKNVSSKFNNMIATIDSLIKERKEAEEKLRYMGYHDPLTKVYNRTYFEKEMQRLRDKEYCAVGIILCDVDGLKIINDTLGHEMGDRLLQKTTEVLRHSIPKGAVLSRIGGDEFAVLIEKTDERILEETYERIKESIGEYNQSNARLSMSVSVGCAVRQSPSVGVDETFREADDYMYKKKLHSRNSNRSAIVKTLSKALEARDFITEGHADRLQELAAGMGKVIGFSEQRIADLQLLAHFHDIGKVGVTDAILFKPGTLTQEEKKEMQRHSEIGYRIAMASPNLAHIADWILKHHEWWNGQGYPIGLRGDEIPLECRILTIVDAYDAMTNDRPYRKAMSHEQAMLELKRGREVTFDPDLVDVFMEMFEETKVYAEGVFSVKI